MEENERRKIATDIMAGLIRKGWILSQHAPDMVKDLDEIIGQNDTLRAAIEDASKHRANMDRARRQRVAAFRDRLR